MPTLVVQLGHCYRRSGATGTTGEQEYATKVGAACRALLHGRGGWSVRLILADDTPSLYRGDAFFAIHCDGSTSAAARGASVGYRTAEGQAVGQAWKRAYAARGWPGFRPDNYTSALAQYYGTGTAVSQGNRRAVILECGFRTNTEDRALLDGAGGPERVALSIGDALGIPAPSQEDDVSFSEKLAVPAGQFKGTQYAAGTMVAWTNYYAAETWTRVNAMAAQIAAIANDKDITPEQLAAATDAAVRKYTPTAEQIAAAVDVAQRPHIEAAVRAVLGEDNVDQADAIVDELVSRLANPTPEGN